MRYWLAALVLCVVLPLYADAAEFDAAHAEGLIWGGRFKEAQEYLEPRASLTEAPRYLCLFYALLAYNEHTLWHCQKAISDSPYFIMAGCVYEEMQKSGHMRQESMCYMWWSDYAKLAELLALHAIGLHRQDDAKSADLRLNMALAVSPATSKPTPWLVDLIAIAMRTPQEQQPKAISDLYKRSPVSERPRFDMAYTMLFPEIIRKDAEAAAARGRWTYIIAGTLASLVLLTGASAYQYRAQIVAYLTTTATPTQPSPPTAPPGAPSFPAYWQAWQAGYMNRAYQIAAYCWVAIWLLLCLPLVLLLAIPAVTILLDFSAAGLQSAIVNARGFAAWVLGWGRLWFALLLVSFAGFAVFKVYGRYSLPKPFRPRIRVIRTTIRLVILAVTVLSVGTFLSYFAGAAVTLYGNPLVKPLIDLLRQLLGL